MRMNYLDWREVRREELLRRDEGGVLRELPARAGRGDAGPDPLPPRRGVPLLPVVLVPAPRHGLPAGRPRDGEGEDEEPQEQRDERGHGEEVAGPSGSSTRRGSPSARRAGAARRRRPPRQAGAVLALLRQQPQARRGDRDRAEQGDEVDARRDVVAHCHARDGSVGRGTRV
jgi:hypothetical protein